MKRDYKIADQVIPANSGFYFLRLVIDDASNPTTYVKKPILAWRLVSIGEDGSIKDTEALPITTDSDINKDPYSGTICSPDGRVLVEYEGDYETIKDWFEYEVEKCKNRKIK